MRLTSRPDPATMGPLLREFGFRRSEEDPADCKATFDADGTPRTVTARYANGWGCQLRLLKSGGYALTQSFSMKFRVGKPVA